jgi:hypothetical protein
MATTISDLVAAVRATNAVIGDPQATQKDLEAAAAAEQETVAAYLSQSHAAWQAAVQAEAGA